jgi:hypothetical protein
MNIPSLIFKNLLSFLDLKVLNFFYVDPGSGILSALDPGSGLEKIGSRINIPDPQSLNVSFDFLAPPPLCPPQYLLSSVILFESAISIQIGWRRWRWWGRRP